MNLVEDFFNKEIAPLAESVKQHHIHLRVAYQDLKSDQHYDVNGEEAGWAASMIKVPVLIGTMRALDERIISLNDLLTIDHYFRLDPTSEISYRAQGSQANIYELLCYMILASCNESTNMLANRVGIPYINHAIESLGCPKTHLSHLLCVGAPLVDGGIDGTSSNTTSANEMTKLMAGIYQAKVASAFSSDLMVRILENDPSIEYPERSINGYLTARLPRGTQVGAKAGLLDEDVMETGVINEDYALTIMFNKVNPLLLSRLGRAISIISKEIFKRYYHG